MLPEQPRQKRNHPLIGEKHVVRIAELPLRLERPVIGLELGELENLRDRDSFGLDLFHGVVLGESGFGAVVDEEAELGGFAGVEWVGERDFVRVDAVFGGDFL